MLKLPGARSYELSIRQVPTRDTSASCRLRFSCGAMAAKITEDKFATAMQPFGGTLLKTSLTEADEKELAGELATQA